MNMLQNTDMANGVENIPLPPCAHFAPSLAILFSFSFILIEFLSLKSLFIVVMLYTAFYSMSVSFLESPLVRWEAYKFDK